MIRWLLGGLALFDVVLGGSAALLPATFAEVVWPIADPAAQQLIRRTGAIWLVFAAAETAACLRPSCAFRLRLVACLRLLDVPADSVWLAFGSGWSGFGLGALISAPPFNLLVGLLCWRAADRAAQSAPSGSGSPPCRSR
ncbi:MAG: hypothetical protein KatS3mg102_0777 [Planctomycetota bacterium]|nr:MAG: hypothetical protein KatS3mg102_0777 [Planctomycetota bacterium]